LNVSSILKCINKCMIGVIEESVMKDANEMLRQSGSLYGGPQL